MVTRTYQGSPLHESLQMMICTHINAVELFAISNIVFHFGITEDKHSDRFELVITRSQIHGSSSTLNMKGLTKSIASV